MAGRASKAGLHRRPPAAVGRPRLFDRAHKDLLGEVLPEVEQLVGEHFHLTSFGPVRTGYEVVTLEGAGPEGVAPSALAKLCRYDRAERPIVDGERVSRYYRVFLQDDNLLTRAETEPGISLRALLRYVVAHELVHVVRFERFEVHYGAEGAARQREEALVHDMTRNILAPLRDPEVARVVELLAHGGVDVFTQGG